MIKRFRHAADAVLQSTPAIRLAEYYANLAPRDRLALKILAWFLGPVIVVFAVLLPATSYMDDALQHYRQALRDNRWMEVNRDAVGRGQAANREPGQSLFGLANATSKGFQISFKRYEPVGDNALSLWMENVSFNNLVLWLERLDKRYGVSVKDISVERLDTEGLVNVRLVLQG